MPAVLALGLERDGLLVEPAGVAALQGIPEPLELARIRRAVAP